jgi:cytochrome c oxidase assembly protein subunit 15
MNIDKNHSVFFRRTSITTLIAVYLLILVGGIVRSTGAGMGCPDWPKCFGMWIPPTDESQLADTYKQDFVEYRKDKNTRFAGYLDILGFKKKADQVRNDPSILTETEFNVTKTWIEYINRLIGVIIGLLIIINFIASIKYARNDRSIFIWSLLLVVLVVFQGWIGSVVVSTNLLPWMVSLHMMLAILIVAILIFLVFRGYSKGFENVKMVKKPLLNMLLVLSGILVIIQILFGTKVREAIDAVALSLNFEARDRWIDMAGLSFIIHRSFTIVILLCQLAILYILYKSKQAGTGISKYANIIFALMILEALVGIIMAYFSIPPFAQPVHLLFAVAIFGLQFLTILIINKPETMVNLNTQAVE